MDDQHNIDELISLRDASKICNLSPDHLRRLVEKRKIWGMKVAGVWLTTRSAVEKYQSMNIRPGRKPAKKMQ